MVLNAMLRLLKKQEDRDVLRMILAVLMGDIGAENIYNKVGIDLLFERSNISRKIFKIVRKKLDAGTYLWYSTIANGRSEGFFFYA